MKTRNTSSRVHSRIRFPQWYIQRLWTVTTDFQALFLTYGVDWDGPSPVDDDNTDAVVVPHTNSPLLPTKLAELRALCKFVL